MGGVGVGVGSTGGAGGAGGMTGSARRSGERLVGGFATGGGATGGAGGMTGSAGRSGERLIGVFAGAAGTGAGAVVGAAAPFGSGGRVGAEVAVAIGVVGASPSACRALNTQHDSVPPLIPISRAAWATPISLARFVAAAFSASVNVRGLDLAMMNLARPCRGRTGCPVFSGQLRVVRVRQQQVSKRQAEEMALAAAVDFD
ncbi:MAG: hypothetical protein WCI17_10610, partial [bacterium]